MLIRREMSNNYVSPGGRQKRQLCASDTSHSGNKCFSKLQRFGLKICRWLATMNAERRQKIRITRRYKMTLNQRCTISSFSLHVALFLIKIALNSKVW